MTRNSTRDRRECVERHGYERGGKTYMRCHICQGEINLAMIIAEMPERWASLIDEEFISKSDELRARMT